MLKKRNTRNYCEPETIHPAIQSSNIPRLQAQQLDCQPGKADCSARQRMCPAFQRSKPCKNLNADGGDAGYADFPTRV
jgi:hypothetical protein